MYERVCIRCRFFTAETVTTCAVCCLEPKKVQRSPRDSACLHFKVIGGDDSD